ncbi:MAG TPA: ABC transporter permease [Vicinamibacterales bacterium]|nr:ABC transporter permease [Vicinamibacterales bacterium]
MMLHDVRDALRLIRLRPASSAAIALTLALAIGANSSLFTIVNAGLLAPLPVRDPDSLVNVYTSGPDGSGYVGLSYPDYLDLRDANLGLDGILGYGGLMATLTGEGDSEVVFGELVTANYFDVLGVAPALGRGFLLEEGEQRGAHAVVVIGDRFWRRRFHADPAVVGKTLSLNGRSYTIVGVSPAGFGGLLFRALSADLWIPVSMMGALRTDHLDNRGERWMFVKGRLARGARPEEAAAAGRLAASRLERAYPETNRGRTFRVLPTADVLVFPDGDRALVGGTAAVMLAASLLLVVACANIAGIMLARGLARRREMAIRLAIGARRRDIVRQLLVESAVLSLLGGAGGLLLARWVAAALASWRPELPVPLSLNTAVDLRVTIFTFGITVIALALFAVAPALRISRTPAAGSMSGATAARRRWIAGKDVVLVPQLALAVLLIGSAALLVRSLSRASAVDPGFDLDRTAFVALNLGMSGYDDGRARGFYEGLAGALEKRGAIGAATSRLPLDIYGNQSATVTPDTGSAERTVQIAQVERSYFEAMGIPLLRGRAFDRAEFAPGAPPVAIVSAETARRYWPGVDPIGRQLRVGDQAASAVVIGVAADVKVQTLGESPQPLVYEPLTSGYTRLLRLVVRTPGDPAPVVGELRRLVRSLDPAVAVFEARTMTDNLSVMLYPYRLSAALGSTFGAIALVLAGIGLYGMLSCGVGERLRELAIRLALGAPAAAIVRTSVAQTAIPVGLGVGVGVVMALGAGQLLSAVLFGISPFDPLALAGTAGILLLVIAAAGATPVRRALRVEPAAILRE